MADTCAVCGIQTVDAILRMDSRTLCDKCESQETRAKTWDSIDTGPRTGDDNLVINELLCFVQGHLGGPPKQILFSVLGDIFSGSGDSGKDIMTNM